MSFDINKITLEGEQPYITLSNLICKGIFDQKFPIAKYFKDYELGDNINEKIMGILEKLEKELIINKEDHEFLINLLTTLFFKLKSHIVEFVERISMADQSLMYRDKMLKEKEERHQSQLKFFITKIKELEKENKTVQDKNREIDRLSSSISTLSLASLEFDENIEKEKKKNKNLQNELNTIKSKLQKEINELKNQKDKQCEKIIELEKNINSNTQIIKTNKNLESKLNELENNYFQLKKKYDEQEDKFKELNSKYSSEMENKNKLLLSVDEQLNQLKNTNTQNINELSEKNNKIIELEKQINSNSDYKKIIIDKDNDITKLSDTVKDIQKKYDELLNQFKNVKEDKNYKKNKYYSRNFYHGRGFQHKNTGQNEPTHHQHMHHNFNQTGINDYNNNTNPIICYVPFPVHPGFQPFPMNPYEQPCEPGFIPFYPNQIYDDGFDEDTYDNSEHNNSVNEEHQSNFTSCQDNA